MIARRDVIRLVTATAATRHLPFALSPEEAAAKLDEPVPFDAGIASPTPDASGISIPSATQFARDLRRAMSLDAFGWLADGGPAEYVAFRQAFQAVEAVVPDALSRGPDYLLGKLDATVMTLSLVCWESGVGVGSEIEHVRQALLRPVSVCHQCNGAARETYLSPMHTPDMQPDDPPRICMGCQGAGILPTAAF